MFQKIKKTSFPPKNKPIFIWDGTCEFCKFWVTRWKSKTVNAITYKTYQEIHTAFPDIPLKEFKKASRLIEPDASIYSGPDSAYRCYDHIPNKTYPFHKWYVRLTYFRALSDHSYNFIAKHRPAAYKLTKLLFGTRPTNHKPYWFIYILVIGLLIFMLFQ